MSHRSFAPLSFLTVAGVVVFAIASGSAAASRESDPNTLIETLQRSTGAAKRRAVKQLLDLGPDALPASRAALERATNPAHRRALTEIVRWQLAEKIRPALAAGIESNLRFDGQYAALAKEGPEIRDTLLALLDDESTPPALRIASCQALADVGKREDVDRLRRLVRDPLFPPYLRDRVGMLLAILGDTYAVDRELDRLQGQLAAIDKTDRFYIPTNLRLAELFYQMRRYPSAVAAYDRILEVYLEYYTQATKNPRVSEEQKRALASEFALQYYNAACSQTLSGDLERAKSSLRECVQLDATHYAHIEIDGDFSKLRASGGYAEFRRKLSELLPKGDF